MEITNISDAKASLSKLIERVQRGEEIVIGKAGRPVAKLVRYDIDAAPRELDGIWRGRVTIHDDFDDLPDDLQRAFLGHDTLDEEPGS